MSESKELKKIKKAYGENFMKLCRSLFPTLLEQEGRLYEILSSSFSRNSKTLYEDIENEKLEEEFKNYIYSKVDVEDSEKRMRIEKTPYELLEEAGYNLTECLTEEEIQGFKKYYKENEELCTFRGGRLDKCVVFWAVKKDIEDIKREKFTAPKREDEYGTSVMGIQFNKQGKCTVSIKNRYNHRVNNPDATYGNDLDRITPGLTNSFKTLLKQKYNLELNSENIEEFEMNGYVVANDGKYYKYNMEIDGNYYCPGNIVIKQGGEVTEVGKPEEGLLIDYFYLDKKDKRITTSVGDSFIDGLQKIEKIEVVKSKDEDINRTIKIYLQDVEEPVSIGIDKNNKIVKYENKNIVNIGDNFLWCNKMLKKLELPNLTKIGDYFLRNNKELKYLELPNVLQVEKWFLSNNEELTHLKLPSLVKTGDCFLFKNDKLTKLELPNLKKAGRCFLYSNKWIEQLELPNLVETKEDFLNENEKLTQLKLPNLKQTGNCFLYGNKELKKLELPNLTEAGGSFLFKNERIEKVELQNLKQVQDDFLCRNQKLKQLKLLNLMKIGDSFLMDNEELEQLELPKLKQVESYFLYENKKLRQLELPSLEQVGSNFLYKNKELKQLKLPKLEETRESFLMNNEGIEQLELPKLKQVGNWFMAGNKQLKIIKLPELTKTGEFFLRDNNELEELELPNLPILKEKFLNIINRNTKEKKIKNKDKITSQSIAKFDNENKVTTSEIKYANKEIEKLTKEKDKSERS